MIALNWPETGAILALATLVTLVFAVLVYLSIGLFDARSLIRRELAAYFLSPIAYVVLVVFLAVTGLLFYHTLEQLTARGPRGTEWPMQMMFADERFWLVFLFIPPLLTMRLFAEERHTGTLEMLMTSPLRDWQVVLSKYVACFAFYILMWLPTLAYLPVLLHLHNFHLAPVFTAGSILLLVGVGLTLAAVVAGLIPLGTRGRLVALALLLVGLVSLGIGFYRHYVLEPGQSSAAQTPIVSVNAGIDPFPALSSYLGIAFAGAMFLAIGLLVSSLVRSQMVAALVALVFSLPFIVAGFWRPDTDSGGAWMRVVYFFSVPLHFQRDFTRGIVDSRHLILYASVAVSCLFLTVRSLESRR
jgi:ABC-type transport system involved in multi-copper enzyme maturation permease subunit